MVSSWSLVKELQDLVEDEKESERYKNLAQSVLDAYKFPVEMSIFCPDGKVLHSINANEYLETKETDSSILEGITEFMDPMTSSYLIFLKKGLTNSTIC
jgi:hypothetical protein